MSFSNVVTSKKLQTIANAKAVSSPADYVRGYEAALNTMRTYTKNDVAALAKVLFYQSGVRNTWEALPPTARGKYINEAAYVARSQGFSVEFFDISELSANVTN